MKDIQYTTKKTAFDLRKNSLNNKIFNVNTTPNGNFIPKQQMLVKQMNSMGKKYMQDNIFKRDREQFLKQKQKPHRQIVMSQQFIKSSKLYKLMKQKIDRSDTMHIKQVNVLNDTKLKLKQQIMQMKTENYQNKISLWELKNKIMELKMIYNEEQEQNKRLIQQERIYQQEQEEEEQAEEEGHYNEEGAYQGQNQEQEEEQNGQRVEQGQNQDNNLQKEQKEAEGPLYIQQQKQMQTKIKLQNQDQYDNQKKQEYFHTYSNPQLHSQIQLERHFYNDFQKRSKQKQKEKEKIIFLMKPKPQHQSYKSHQKQSNKQKNSEDSIQNQNKSEQNNTQQKIKVLEDIQIQNKSEQRNLVHSFIDFSILNKQGEEDELFHKLKIKLGINSYEQINNEEIQQTNNLKKKQQENKLEIDKSQKTNNQSQVNINHVPFS